MRGSSQRFIYRLSGTILCSLMALAATTAHAQDNGDETATDEATPAITTGEAIEAAADDAAETVAAVAGHAERTLKQIPDLWWIAPIGAILALVFAAIFFAGMKSADEGDELMQRISKYVRDGAMAYLRQQYKIVFVVFVVLCAVLAFMAYGLHVQHPIVPFAFLTGGFFSGLCGWIGMYTATLASHRTTAGARKSLNDGLVVAFRSGAVMGLVVVGFGLIDIVLWFLLLYSNVLPFEMSLNDITVVMLTFGMGASTQALFARVGGGIYTKAADVGADLVGKVEAGIPEDDARNPATIADNVGDNVGDVAGMGADLYESYCGSILATAALGVAAATAIYGGSESLAFDAAMKMLAAPMVLAGIGIVLSIVGIFMVRTKEGATMSQLLNALRIGIYGSTVLIAVAAWFVCDWLLTDISGEGITVNPAGIFGAIMVGLIAGNIIGYATEYYTSYEYEPTKKIAEQAVTGSATVIIAGVAAGMKSTWTSLITIIVSIILAFVFAGGAQEFLLGLYGVGIAAVGMLATLGITLATDAYGPIADNAGGNAEMSHQQPIVRERTDALDSLGNTTAATGKGFAIGSAALTALALLAAYVEEVRFGQVREAKAFLASVDRESNLQLDQTRAMYMGHGKMAVFLSPEDLPTVRDADEYLNDDQNKRTQKLTRDYSKDPESMFDSLMVLDVDSLPDSIRPGEQIRGIGAPDPNDENVRTLNFDGQTIRLVSARRASLQQFMAFYDVTLMNPKTLCGIFAGVMLVFLFCAMTLEAVGRAAYQMMMECRNQFQAMREYLRSEGNDEAYVNNPDNWPREQIDYKGGKLPDYAKAVEISTKGAQREMVVPSLIAIAVPVLVGLLFDVPGVMGLLAGGLTSGFAVAIFMANAGGAWDNAKKWIETGKHGGKGSDAHKAGVVGDTVGDPFKDTSGPSLNILIKLMSMVSVVFAGLIVKYAPQISSMLGL